MHTYIPLLVSVVTLAITFLNILSSEITLLFFVMDVVFLIATFVMICVSWVGDLKNHNILNWIGYIDTVLDEIIR